MIIGSTLFLLKTDYKHVLNVCKNGVPFSAWINGE